MECAWGPLLRSETTSTDRAKHLLGDVEEPVTEKSKKLVIGLPKGSLEESTLDLFARAGFKFYGSERSLWLTSNDPELEPVLLRPQEITLYVADGSLDCGLAGDEIFAQEIGHGITRHGPWDDEIEAEYDEKGQEISRCLFFRKQHA